MKEIGIIKIVNWKHYRDKKDPWCPLCQRPRSVHQDPIEVRFPNLSDDKEWVKEEPEKVFVFCVPCAESMVAPAMPEEHRNHPYMQPFTAALQRRRFGNGHSA